MKLFFLTLFGLILAAQLAFAEPGTSNHINSDALCCRFTLVQKTISVGEPIIVHVQITNQRDQPAHIYMGEYDGYWWSASLRDGTGKTLPALPTPVPFPSALGRVVPTLSPGASDQEVVVLSTRFGQRSRDAIPLLSKFTCRIPGPRTPMLSRIPIRCH